MQKKPGVGGRELREQALLGEQNNSRIQHSLHPTLPTLPTPYTLSSLLPAPCSCAPCSLLTATF
ncbi:hypothetical protein [Chroococcidiopsis sp.]|uniref:hypothetical protein n=1 Tax=Chroococcidiopsis sp. TaxID=3088168 RepID=UPI003F3834FA